jgi:hypothetical protein
MKTIFRVLMLGMMMSAVSAVSVFAQDVCTEVEAKQGLYKKFTDNYAGTLDQKESAVEAGDQYISKYGACTEDKDIVAYLNTNLPKMKDFIKQQRIKQDTGVRYTRFDKAIDAANTAEIFSSGKEILAKEPDFVDVTIAMATAGFDQSIANPPVDTFSNDTITYSKMAIQQIEANKASKTGDYGVKKYGYKTKEFPDAKNNALGLMNYNIGYILYYRQGKTDPAKKKEALPYFYKSTQYNAFSKTDPFVYQTIGAWYLDEAIRLDTERTAKVKAAGNKDTDETLALLGTVKGYVDRSIDAYGRAYKLASTATPADPKRKDALYAKLKELYAFRYDGKVEGIDAFVATVMNNPMPDPTTEPTPVKEAPATTTTTSGTGGATAMTSDTTSENTAGMAKPTGTKAGAAANSKATTNGAAATTKTAAKKPAPKKKGTR